MTQPQASPESSVDPSGALRQEAEPAIQESRCSTDPDAQHGFDRNASHTAGRYVCECEGSQTDVADIIAGELQTSRGHAYELMRRAVAAADDRSLPPIRLLSEARDVLAAGNYANALCGRIDDWLATHGDAS